MSNEPSDKLKAEGFCPDVVIRVENTIVHFHSSIRQCSPVLKAELQRNVSQTIEVGNRRASDVIQFFEFFSKQTWNRLNGKKLNP